jgi:hypothetical protein
VRKEREEGERVLKGWERRRVEVRMKNDCVESVGASVLCGVLCVFNDRTAVVLYCLIVPSSPTVGSSLLRHSGRTAPVPRDSLTRRDVDEQWRPQRVRPNYGFTPTRTSFAVAAAARGTWHVARNTKHESERAAWQWWLRDSTCYI